MKETKLGSLKRNVSSPWRYSGKTKYFAHIRKLIIFAVKYKIWISIKYKVGETLILAILKTRWWIRYATHILSVQETLSYILNNDYWNLSYILIVSDLEIKGNHMRPTNNVKRMILKYRWAPWSSFSQRVGRFSNLEYLWTLVLTGQSLIPIKNKTNGLVLNRCGKLEQKPSMKQNTQKRETWLSGKSKSKKQKQKNRIRK